MSGSVRAASVIALCVAAYLLGLYGGYARTWPVPQLKALVAARLKPSVHRDEFGRLLDYPGKVAVPCPAQDKATAVLLVSGQSNAGNYQGQRYAGIDDRVINFSQGRCTIASSPLLGADGHYGESWTLLGNKLIRANLYSTVVLIPASVGSTPIHRWAAGGDLDRMLVSVLRDTKPRYAITAILWHQGATDYTLHTPENTYRSDLESLIQVIRDEGVAAPFYVSKSSYQQAADWSEDNPVSRAQAALVDGRAILAGPDTDHEVTAIDRFDGLHFSASGQEKFTDAWVRLLRAQRSAEQ